MAKITYIEFNGAERVYDIEPGTSVMRGAVTNDVRGIIGECGGACQCGTCHVYVDPAWTDKLPPKTDNEEALLEGVCDARPNSRLSCQISVSDALDGLVVRLPEYQM